MRDKDQTKQKILQAVGKLLATGGGLGVNVIAREAGVDKVLIYRYFGGLPELLRAFMTSGEFWPEFEDVMETSPYVAAMLPPDEIMTRFVHGFIRELRSRPVTLEMLRQELTEPSELTTELVRVRDERIHEVAECFSEQATDMRASLALVAAGLIHLLLTAKSGERFCGIELRTEAAWEEIERAAGTIGAEQ